ncbi:MAG: ABC transporter permease [Treponema sp.]|nr:ABC transporter permease [Treponema sp.]
MKKYFQSKSFVIGFSIICFYVLFMLVGLFYLPYDPDFPDAAEKFAPISFRHLLGTDHLGRDVFSRILVGTRISFAIGFSVMVSGCTIGLLLGAASGYFGGWLDVLIQKLISVQMSFPGILLALMLIAVFGTDMWITVSALCFMSVPRFTRISRASFMKHKNSLFVKSAQARGAGHLRIMLFHILPNIVPELLVTCSLSFALAILSESGLSYLGLGIQPPTPSFGRMLNDAQRFIFRNPIGVLIPAFFLTALVTAFNLLGDGISEAGGRSGI